MKTIARFLLSISVLVLSLPAVSDPPADGGVKRTEVIGEDNWAITNPISLGTITCPGGELAYDADGAVTESGAVYLFQRNAGGADAWGQILKLTAGDGATVTARIPHTELAVAP